jgi:hypothetical protein
LARIGDPRHRRGVRHQLAVILGLALCAVVAGARSFTAIAEWAADADEQTLRVLGVTRAVSSESTFRQTLQRLDADALDDLAGAWAQQATRPGPKQRRVMAVDGKTLRGSASRGEAGGHLLAALDHAHGAVLGQVEVSAKTNEIPMFPVLIDRVDITGGAVITAWCVQHDDIPELIALARTISRWEHEITAAVITWLTNATAESLNRLAKLEARHAYGFRNPVNQRRRVRIACTRGYHQRSRTATSTGTRTVIGQKLHPG